MDDVATLKAEIARLRDVCEEFDVDPDWAPVAPLYGPPVAPEMLDRLIAQVLTARSSMLAVSVTRNNAFLRHLMLNSRS